MEYFKKNGAVFRDSAPEDVKLLADNMRQNDIAEVTACGESPYESVKNSYDNSVISITGEFDGKIICMGGVAEFFDPKSSKTVSTLWCLSSKELEKHKIAFAIASKICLKIFLKRYPILQNFVDAKYTQCCNWIKWLGGELGPEIPWLNGASFRHFEFRR